MKADRRSQANRLQLVTVAAALLTLTLPVLVVALSRSDRSVGDIALIELRTRDVFSAHPPLTGVYSRYGWSHPGPMMYAAYALPYRLLGGNADALRLTALFVNTVALVTLTWLAWRRGRAATAMVLATAVALVWGMPPNSLTDGWNVTIAVVPLLLTIVACWCALCGDGFAFLVAAISFAFVIQSHIGFGVVVAPLFVATAVWMTVRAVRGRDPVEGRQLAWGGLALAVLFLPVAYDVAAHWPGNIGRLAKWSVTNDETKVGIADGLRMIGRTSSLSFPFHPQQPGTFLLAIDRVEAGFAPGVLLVALGLALAVAWRRGWKSETFLCASVAVVWVSGLIAAATITRPLAPWLIEWLQPLGWITWGAVVLVTWRSVAAACAGRRWWPSAQRGVLGIAIIALVGGTAAYAHGAATTNYLSTNSRSALDALTAGAESVAGTEPLAFEFSGDPLDAGTMMSGVVNRLDAAGYKVCVARALAYQFGSSRVCDPSVHERLLVRSEPEAAPPPDGATTVAIADPLSSEDRQEADRLTAELAEMLISSGLDQQVPLLYSPLVDLVLAGDPPQAIVDAADDVHRLQALRQTPGVRFGLYRFDDGVPAS